MFKLIRQFLLLFLVAFGSQTNLYYYRKLGYSFTAFCEYVMRIIKKSQKKLFGKAKSHNSLYKTFNWSDIVFRKVSEHVMCGSLIRSWPPQKVFVWLLPSNKFTKICYNHISKQTKIDWKKLIEKSCWLTGTAPTILHTINNYVIFIE